MTTYRVAIIGLGRMGSTIDDEHPQNSPYSIAAACQSSERLQVIAGADIEAEKRTAFQTRWGVNEVYEDYEVMIRETAPDLVAICTRGHLHAEMAAKTAEAGIKMIYCEKAIACSMQEADAVLTAVQSSGSLFNTGVLRRYNARYHQARQLIEQGEIGEPQWAVHYAATNLLHGHIHSLDTLSFLLGDPKIESVWGELYPRDLQIVDNKLDEDPYGIYHIVFENGIEATSVHRGPWEFEILGTEGSLRVLNNGGDILLRKIGSDGGRNWQPVSVPEIDDARSPTVVCLEDLVEAYEANRPTLEGVEVSHHLTEACLAVTESHRLKQRVTLPLENRSLYVFHR